MERNNVQNRIAVFFALVLIVVAIIGGALLVVSVSNSAARIEEARAIQAQVQPDIIIARSQASINNAAALSGLKDSALVILLVILLAKDILNEKTR